jgi:hypothetical protein
MTAFPTPLSRKVPSPALRDLVTQLVSRSVSPRSVSQLPPARRSSFLNSGFAGFREHLVSCLSRRNLWFTVGQEAAEEFFERFICARASRGCFVGCRPGRTQRYFGRRRDPIDAGSNRIDNRTNRSTIFTQSVLDADFELRYFLRRRDCMETLLGLLFRQ